jgi:hypothetical protein
MPKNCLAGSFHDDDDGRWIVGANKLSSFCATIKLNVLLSIPQKIEKPFLAAVSQTLGDRYTDNVEGIYKITIKFIIETLVEGYEAGLKQQNHVGNSKSVNSSNNNTNGANATTQNGDTSCNSRSKPSTDAS